MATPNYVTRTKQWEINSLIDDIYLITGMSYPEDSLLDIMKSYIPGLSVVEHDFDGDRKVRGAIYKKSEQYPQPMIVIQKRQPKPMKTFSLAHEFAHYCLNHPGDANFMIDKVEFDGSEEMQKEAEAQYFAGALLMPLSKFSELAKFLSVSQLAQRFGVSESAVQVRRAWLDGRQRDRAL